MIAVHGRRSARLGSVERFVSRVRETPRAEHSYAALLGLRTFEVSKLHARLREGLSYQSLERVQRILDISSAQISKLVGISARTLARRRETGRLAPDESDRLLRMARVIGHAVILFEGDLDATRRWLTRSQVSLGGIPPIVFATTEVGTREVENLIGRIEQGISA